jgi:hypothetical protein
MRPTEGDDPFVQKDGASMRSSGVKRDSLGELPKPGHQSGGGQPHGGKRIATAGDEEPTLRASYHVRV